MAFLIYFFVLLVSAASVLFGLDLMNSPLPNMPNVPIGRSVQVASPPMPRERRAADERALTPVYPAAPGKPEIQAVTSGAAAQDEAKTDTVAAAQPAAQQASNSCNPPTAAPIFPKR